MTKLLEFWLPFSSFTLLCFGLVLKTAHQHHRIRLLEGENAGLRKKQAELESDLKNVKEEVEKKRAKRRVWPDDYGCNHKEFEQTVD